MEIIKYEVDVVVEWKGINVQKDLTLISNSNPKSVKVSSLIRKTNKN